VPSTIPSTANFDTQEFRISSGPSFHGAITAYKAGASGAGVTIGIVDSGVANVGGEFTGRISALSRDFAGNGSITDVGGHGTAVAETLAGARNDAHVMGMAWGATIMALRTDKPGTCVSSGGCEHSTTDIAEAVDYAWRNGARVVNISLGGDPATPDLLAAVSRATAAGTIIVIAAGNSGTGTPSASPGALAASIANPIYSHGLVIIATSVDSDGTISSFSNRAGGHEETTLSALGNSVRTINQAGADYYYTGTSFSAPQIAGAAALLAEAFPSLSSAQIVQLLLSTARDAGATGTDSVYGTGILDVGSAFSPQGTTSLAGSSVPVNGNETTILSAPMGDAGVTGPAGLATVILDGYGRPFEADLSAAVSRRAAMGALAGTLLTPNRSFNSAAGPLSLAFSIAPGREGQAAVAGLALDRIDAARARLLSATISASLAGRGSIALGLRTSARSLESTLRGVASPAFLVAADGAGALTPELRAAASFAIRQPIGRGFSLTNAMENGSVARERQRPGLALNPATNREGLYQAISMGLAYDRGPLGLAAGARLLNEEGSTLGARFAATFGAQSARSLFLAMGADYDLGAGLTLAGSYQRGWTYAAAGGALTGGGLLESRSWSIDLAGRDVLMVGDMLGLRAAAPLRVVQSRFNLLLPDSWDWKTRTATSHVAPLALVPGGSERDYELSYGRSLGGAWIATNVFLRSQPGNIAAAPVDYGAAVRWALSF
jgi:hypothetical protein